MKFSTRSEGNKCPIMITALAVIIILLIVSFYAFYIAMEAETDIRYNHARHNLSRRLSICCRDAEIMANSQKAKDFEFTRLSTTIRNERRNLVFLSTFCTFAPQFYKSFNSKSSWVIHV